MAKKLGRPGYNDMPMPPPPKKPAKYPMSHAKGSNYTDVKRREVASLFAVLGNQREVAKITGVPETTICKWRKTAWWDAFLQAARSEHEAEVDAMQSRIIKEANQVVMDRLRNGDYKILKDGTLKRVPVTAKDAATVGAITFDKRQIARSLPTSINVNAGDMLAQMADNMRRLAQSAQRSEPIDVTPEDSDK